MRYTYTINCDLDIESSEILTAKEIEKLLNIIVKNPAINISNVELIDVND